MPSYNNDCNREFIFYNWRQYYIGLEPRIHFNEWNIAQPKPLQVGLMAGWLARQYKVKIS